MPLSGWARGGLQARGKDGFKLYMDKANAEGLLPWATRSTGHHPKTTSTSRRRHDGGGGDGLIDQTGVNMFSSIIGYAQQPGRARHC